MESKSVVAMTPVETLIAKFQCPGCVCGIDPTTCRQYNPNPKRFAQTDQEYFVQIGQTGVCCTNHVLGTSSLSYGHFALGLPKGFSRPPRNFSYRPQPPSEAFPNEMNIRLWPIGTRPRWDSFNVPVWAVVQDGFLFVRTYSPRTGNGTAVDVIENGTLDLVPNAIDVSVFFDEID